MSPRPSTLAAALRRSALTGAMLLALPAGSAFAQTGCPSALDAAAIAAHHAARETVTPPPPMSISDAECGREKLTHFLAQSQGKIVGYKAGLTNPAVQKRFGHDSPIRGTLFSDMLLKDSAEIPARYGAKPIFEADLVVEVGDSGINRARTRADAIRHLSRIYPFIELPDLMVDDPSRLTGASLVYLNVVARLGVLGAPLDVASLPSPLDTLADMTVRLVDENGKELDTAKGTTILGHPIDAVLWLVEDLQRAGITLKKGDLLSLGSFSKPLAPKAGGSAKVIYEGLPGTPSVSVRFR